MSPYIGGLYRRRRWVLTQGHTAEQYAESERPGALSTKRDVFIKTFPSRLRDLCRIGGGNIVRVYLTCCSIVMKKHHHQGNV